MNIKLIFYRLRQNSNTSFLIAAIFWGMGLVTGILFSLPVRDLFPTILTNVLHSEPIPYLVLLANLLPVIIISLLLWRDILSLCYPIFFFKALCHGFCGMAVHFALGSGSWVFRPLFLISANFVSIVLWWLFLRYATYRHANLTNAIIISCMFVCSVSLVDIYFVTPYLNHLVNYF